MQGLGRAGSDPGPYSLEGRTVAGTHPAREHEARVQRRTARPMKKAT